MRHAVIGLRVISIHTPCSYSARRYLVMTCITLPVGYMGFVPHQRELFGGGQEVTTHQALNTFTEDLKTREKNSKLPVS